MDEIALFAAKRDGGGDRFTLVEGFTRPSEDALLNQGNAPTRNPFGMPAEVIPAAEYTGCNNGFAGATSTNFNSVTVLNEGCDIGGNFFDLIAQFDFQERAAEMPRFQAARQSGRLH